MIEVWFYRIFACIVGPALVLLSLFLTKDYPTEAAIALIGGFIIMSISSSKAFKKGSKVDE
ncbi:hypothetical protein AVT65_gp40 [Gordonia phage Gmala1]|uniref:Uncharacterized protein n=1 Tax=Gordonia phage Gmala1 TaxID=1622190 RepID=A0A0E3XBF4_9CAUD|nr:hypothetical protein AVT65_gp40 [Gordonia phage Gmala1]AKC02878.1 hypothetical protein Gmala1_40 [Gordonia phage Gmala1]